MAIPKSLLPGLKLPAVAAPMFLTSGPDLVVEACRSGVIGAFPALNQRSAAGLADWLDAIADPLDVADLCTRLAAPARRTDNQFRLDKG